MNLIEQTIIDPRNRIDPDSLKIKSSKEYIEEWFSILVPQFKYLSVSLNNPSDERPWVTAHMYQPTTREIESPYPNVGRLFRTGWGEGGMSQLSTVREGYLPDGVYWREDYE